MTTYREFLDKAVRLRVFRGEFGQRLIQGTIGVLFDGLAETYRQAVRASWIGDTIGPAYDALGSAGHELNLPRYPSESWDQYHERLKRAWVDWAVAGDESSILGQLAGHGLTAEIKTAQDWDWDGDAANWSRFWVVITGHPWQGWTWGDGHMWGGGQTWGSTATAEEVRAVRAIVRKWKPGHWVCSHIIVVLDETTWNAEQPDGTWGDPANRSNAAVYWPG